MYKKASRLGLRFQTNKGLLSVEQLWQLKLKDLSDAIKSVKKTLKDTNDDELSFLDETTVVDSDNQLRFDILKDVYLTLKGEKEAIRDKTKADEHNRKIDELIARKQEAELENLSIDELEKLRK